MHSGERVGSAARVYLEFIVGIKADLVSVQWIQGETPAGFPIVAYYLGESNEVMVLFESSTHKV
jgi:hypothetical protein